MDRRQPWINLSWNTSSYPVISLSLLLSLSVLLTLYDKFLVLASPTNTTYRPSNWAFKKRHYFFSNHFCSSNYCTSYFTPLQTRFSDQISDWNSYFKNKSCAIYLETVMIHTFNIWSLVYKYICGVRRWKNKFVAWCDIIFNIYLFIYLSVHFIIINFQTDFMFVRAFIMFQTIFTCSGMQRIKVNSMIAIGKSSLY